MDITRVVACWFEFTHNILQTQATTVGIPARKQLLVRLVTVVCAHCILKVLMVVVTGAGGCDFVWIYVTVGVALCATPRHASFYGSTRRVCSMCIKLDRDGCKF